MAKQLKSENPLENLRSRNWRLIVYPESAPLNWMDSLDELNIPAAVSPLHDRDIKADGLPDKPHYHVILCFSGNKSFSQIMGISKSIGSGVAPFVCESVSGMYAYLTHANHPSKAQYSSSDIRLFGGFQPPEDKVASSDTLRQIVQYCIDNKVTEVSEIIQMSLTSNPEWFDVLFSQNNFMLLRLLDSQRWVNRSVPKDKQWFESYDPIGVSRVSAERCDFEDSIREDF